MLWLAATIAFWVFAAPAPKVIVHKGDPLPQPGILWSFDSVETEREFEKLQRSREYLAPEIEL